MKKKEVIKELNLKLDILTQHLLASNKRCKNLEEINEYLRNENKKLIDKLIL
jgi:hypothetical protein